MKQFTNTKALTSKFATLLAVVTMGGALLVSGQAVADAVSTTASSTAGASASSTSSTDASGSATTKKQADPQTIISRGDQEIERRLTTLSTLTNKINAASKLSVSDKATLSGEVSSTITSLTSLKTQLDADTTLNAARTNAASIYTEYRVYALVAPKVELIKVADDQQVIQTKLTTMAQKLQSRITVQQKAGKDVTTLQAKLSDMTAQTVAAQAISSNIESMVISLQPSDYNSNHAVLSGDNTQLKTAHADDQAALSDAKAIVGSLKSTS